MSVLNNSEREKILVNPKSEILNKSEIRMTEMPERLTFGLVKRLSRSRCSTIVISVFEFV